EKILSFDLIENTLKTEFERPIIKSNNTKYFSKVIWTKKDSYDVSIPNFMKIHFLIVFFCF
ncbi:hypothetical protein, partial [Streptococcus pneumoniae]|uniref:hypothetical protein n=1 Tax=Streptococcus pneumoniae TaxID=1313 RepID=UPI001D009CDB